MSGVLLLPTNLGLTLRDVERLCKKHPGTMLVPATEENREVVNRLLDSLCSERKQDDKATTTIPPASQGGLPLTEAQQMVRDAEISIHQILLELFSAGINVDAIKLHGIIETDGIHVPSSVEIESKL